MDRHAWPVEVCTRKILVFMLMQQALYLLSHLPSLPSPPAVLLSLLCPFIYSVILHAPSLALSCTANSLHDPGKGAPWYVQR